MDSSPRSSGCRRLRWLLTGLLAALLLPGAGLALAQDAAPAWPYNAAVAARFPAPAERYGAAVLADGAEGFTSNPALAAQLAGLAAAPPPGTRIARLALGKSQGGLALEALHFSRSPAVPATGTLPARAVVLLMGQQHGDEPASAEALLVVAGLLATGDLNPVLAQLDVIVLPRANPDGAEWQRRVSANGLDINRDHLLLRTPEAQALASLVRQHRPAVVVDVHEHTVVGRYLDKFNAVQRHDLLLQYAMAANLPAALGRASEDWFRQPMLAALSAQGLTAEWYYTNPTPPDDLRLSMGGVQPDTGRNVNGLRHAISLLLESRGVGIGRLHLARRVHAHVVALRSVLTQAAHHAGALLALQAQADAEVAAQACDGRAVVQAGPTATRRELLMLDPLTGADKPLQVHWESALQLKVQTERQRPCGYWLAADQTRAVQALQALGVQVRQLAAPTVLSTEAYVERGRRALPRLDVRGQVAEGDRTILLLLVDTEAGDWAAPAGSWYVTMAQPLANLVIAALEPDSQNSYLANRLLAPLAATRRVMVPPPAAAWLP